MAHDPQAEHWRKRNVACWHRTAAWQDELSRMAPKRGLRLYHAERRDHAIRMATEWQHGLRSLDAADAG